MEHQPTISEDYARKRHETEGSISSSNMSSNTFGWNRSEVDSCDAFPGRRHTMADITQMWKRSYVLPEGGLASSQGSTPSTRAEVPSSGDQLPAGNMSDYFPALISAVQTTDEDYDELFQVSMVALDMP